MKGMHQHEELKKSLQTKIGEVFLTDVVLHQWVNNRDHYDRKVLFLPVEEVSFSLPTARKDKIGRPMVKTGFIDVVLFVGSGKSAAYHGDVFSIGVEIKSNLFDLMQDEKIPKYVGITDFCYLAVLEGLIDDALIKVKDMPGVGVLSLSTGHIVKQARRQNVPLMVRQQLLYRVLLGKASTFTISEESIGESFQVVQSFSEDDPKGSSDVTDNNSLTIKNNKTMSFVGNRTHEARLPRLELKNGKFSLWMGDGQPCQEFDYAEGQLTGIEIRKCQTRNGEMIYCEFKMINGEERFYISTLASSGVTADLVSRLKNVKDPANSMLRIDAWQNNRYTNVVMKENGLPIVHASLPRVVKIDRGFKMERDSSARDAAVMKIISEINAKLLPKSEGGQN